MKKKKKKKKQLQVCLSVHYKIRLYEQNLRIKNGNYKLCLIKYLNFPFILDYEVPRSIHFTTYSVCYLECQVICQSAVPALKKGNPPKFKNIPSKLVPASRRGDHDDASTKICNNLDLENGIMADPIHSVGDYHHPLKEHPATPPKLQNYRLH